MGSVTISSFLHRTSRMELYISYNFPNGTIYTAGPREYSLLPLSSIFASVPYITDSYLPHDLICLIYLLKELRAVMFVFDLTLVSFPLIS